MKYIFMIILAVLLGLIIIILIPFIWIFYKIVMVILDKLDDWFGGLFE